MKTQILLNLIFSLSIAVFTAEISRAQVTSPNGNYYFQNNIQRLHGNGGTSLNYYSNHSNYAAINLFDKEGLLYGGIHGGNNGAYIGFTNSDGHFPLIAYKNLYTDFRMGIDTKMRILANGNVGIGTTSPIQKLDVAGNINIDGGSLLLRKPNTTGGWARGVFNTDDSGTRLGGMGLLGNANGPVRYFISHGSSPWSDSRGTYFFTDGSVGICTISVPLGYKLAVDGKIIAEEVRVKPSENWPDYVFADEYNLLSIQDLEKYVSTNQHLPNVPSAEEIEQQGGADLGAMNVILLEKVEELTLYIIQMNKKIEALNQEVETLQNK